MTDLFRGWNDAETTGASNRTTALRFGGSLSDARSHMQTFQSLLDVSMYRAFLEKLFVRFKLRLRISAYKTSRYIL